MLQVLFRNVVHSHMCEGWHFTEMWTTLEWLHDCTSQTPPLFTEMHVPRPCICLIRVLILPLFTIRFIFWILELYRQCNILELYRQCNILELYRQCNILELCTVLKYYTVCTVLKYYTVCTVLKYYTVCTVLKYYTVCTVLKYYTFRTVQTV
jgi:hypothetical protein